MNQSFYTGAVSAQQQNMRMGIQGNNLANINTYGFKAEKGRFGQLVYQQIKAADDEEQLVGSGASLLMSSTDHRAGSAYHTGRTQDYMIDGDGFFALKDLATNKTTFTRSGAFVVAQAGEGGRWYLTDGQGRFVLGKNGEPIEVTDPSAEQPVGIFDFDKYDGMQHTNGTRFVWNEKDGNVRVGTGKLLSGYLENSNVDLAEEMTKVIETQRAYGMALKLVQASDELETTINNLRG